MGLYKIERKKVYFFPYDRIISIHKKSNKKSNKKLYFLDKLNKNSILFIASLFYHISFSFARLSTEKSIL